MVKNQHFLIHFFGYMKLFENLKMVETLALNKTTLVSGPFKNSHSIANISKNPEVTHKLLTIKKN